MHFIVIVKDESGDRVTEGGYKVSIQVQFSEIYNVFTGYLEREVFGTWEALVVRDNGDAGHILSIIVQFNLDFAVCQ